VYVLFFVEKNISISPFHHYLFTVLVLLNTNILDKQRNVRTSQTRTGSRNRNFLLLALIARLERISTEWNTVVMCGIEERICYNSILSSYFMEYPSPQSYYFVQHNFTKLYYVLNYNYYYYYFFFFIYCNLVFPRW